MSLCTRAHIAAGRITHAHLQDLIFNLLESPLVVCALYHQLVALLLQVRPFLGYHHTYMPEWTDLCEALLMRAVGAIRFSLPITFAPQMAWVLPAVFSFDTLGHATASTLKAQGTCWQLPK